MDHDSACHSPHRRLSETGEPEGRIRPETARPRSANDNSLSPGATLKLRLYVARGQVHSTAALDNLEALLKGAGVRFELQILDVFEQTELARHDRVLVAPTLIRLVPPPRQRLTGTLHDRSALAAALSLPDPPSETT